MFDPAVEAAQRAAYSVVEWQHARWVETHAPSPGDVRLRDEHGADPISAECIVCGEVLLPARFELVISAAREALVPLRESLANAIQVATSGTTGSPPNIDGVTEREALDIMSEALINAARFIYPSEDL